MKIFSQFSLSCLVLALVCSGGQLASAQGLLWTVPRDGLEIRYEGTLQQTVIDEDLAEETFNWDRRLTIRSFGPVEEEFEGEEVPCWWIELKLETGKASELGIDSEPLGPRLYKVLVPETVITGSSTTELGLPIDALPIVRGYKQVRDGDPEPLGADVLQVFPLLSLIRHYRPEELVEAGEEFVATPAGRYDATRYQAQTVIESPGSRVASTAILLVSRDVPVGPVQWEATMERSVKDVIRPRSTFRIVTKMKETMELREIGTALQSELVAPGE
ncbi:hypothetical protein [Calycomorphotria hydatis]|nr:hypothetical protein [Calycomorphotria hydatis]